MSPSACILGCRGPVLERDEAAFFREVKPFGFILFRRNVESPDQTRALTEALREAVGRGDAPILVDQEGGRVQRFGPPHWPRYPAASAYLAAAEGALEAAAVLARLGARLIAHDLKALGVTVDCAPVLDVPHPGAHDVIGDRALGPDRASVAKIGRAFCEGLLAGGVAPVIKHMPGHGRALADSHHDLPVVDAPRAALEAADFMPFRVCADMPAGMTAHVVYAALDEARPATTSKTVIGLIRRDLGFDGLLMTDDLSMRALSGGFAKRARAALKAGCDLALHCNGDRDEAEAVAKGAGALKGESRRRAQAFIGRISQAPEPLDVDRARARFNEAFGGAIAEAASGPRVGE